MTADAPSPPRRLTLLEWRAFRKNTLLGFCVVDMGPSAIVLRDISVHQRDGKAWISLPARPQVGRDDKVVRTHNGKAQYSQVIGFRNRELADRFSEAVLALIREAHPEAFEP